MIERKAEGEKGQGMDGWERVVDGQSDQKRTGGIGEKLTGKRGTVGQIVSTPQMKSILLQGIFFISRQGSTLNDYARTGNHFLLGHSPKITMIQLIQKVICMRMNATNLIDVKKEKAKLNFNL